MIFDVQLNGREINFHFDQGQWLVLDTNQRLKLLDQTDMWIKQNLPHVVVIADYKSKDNRRQTMRNWLNKNVIDRWSYTGAGKGAYVMGLGVAFASQLDAAKFRLFFG